MPPGPTFSAGSADPPTPGSPTSGRGRSPRTRPSGPSSGRGSRRSRAPADGRAGGAATVAADMSASWLELDRERILAHRQRVGALDARLPRSADSLRAAAWAGVPDSMPRAALHSLHARVEAADGSIWEDPSLVQVWGPRYSVHVVAE